MNLDKLKEAARKFEQKEEWRRAIEIYLKAIQEVGSAAETIDPGLYNRVGDLEMKAGDSGAALRAYEQAAELYADQGFYNNAIALCGKILRVNPGRTATYLRLAQLHARKNVVSEAKRNLLEYIERMHAVHQLDDAFKAVKAFADQFNGSQDIRLMLSELLRAASRTADAREQLEKLAGDLDALGDQGAADRARERLSSLDMAEPASPAAEPAAPAPASPKSRGPNDLIFLDTGVTHGRGPRFESPSPDPSSVPEEDSPSVERLPDLTFEETEGLAASGVERLEGLEPPAVDPLSGLDTTRDPTVPSELGFDIERSDVFEGSIGDEPASPVVEGLEKTWLESSDPTPPLEGMQSDWLVPPLPLGVDAGPAAETDLPEFDAGLAEAAHEPDPAMSFLDDDIVFLEVPFEGPPATGGIFEGLDLELPPEMPASSLPPPAPPVPLAEDAPFDALEDAAGDQTRVLQEAAERLEAGDRRAGIQIMEEALGAFEAESRWEEAISLVDDLIRLEPDGIGWYQKRVELSYHTGDRGLLVRSYLALGDVLVRVEALDSAVAVYTRVLEHEPGNALAQAALDALTPAPGKAVEPDLPADFVDLGALILDQEPVRDTRMRVEAEAPVGDEDKDFLETLVQFKRGIEANIDSEDFQSHYDLGIAFKEMGLLDEAIAQFQKALRAPAGRLKTSEALGVAFFEKGRLAISEAVLERAVDGLDGGDDEKIGVIYWLGRAQEGQGRMEQALKSYERALAVDIRFLDLSERIQRLTQARSAT